MREYSMYILSVQYVYLLHIYVLALKEITFRGTKFEVAKVACILAKCVTTRLWEQSKFVSKLIPKVGPVLSRSFVLNGKTTLQSITETDPRNIERVSFVIYSCKLYLYKYTYIQSHAVIIWLPGHDILF